MGRRTFMTTLAATLAIGVLGTAAAGAETEEEMNQALEDCQAAGGELIVDEHDDGDVWFWCLGGDDEMVCAEKTLQVDGDDWVCVYFDRDDVIVETRDPVTTTGGYGGTGSITEPTARPPLTASTTPVRRLG